MNFKFDEHVATIAKATNWKETDYGKVPEYLIEKRRQEEEAQREYDAYIQVRYSLRYCF